MTLVHDTTNATPIAGRWAEDRKRYLVSSSDGPCTTAGLYVPDPTRAVTVHSSASGTRRSFTVEHSDLLRILSWTLDLYRCIHREHELVLVTLEAAYALVIDDLDESASLAGSASQRRLVDYALALCLGGDPGSVETFWPEF